MITTILLSRNLSPSTIKTYESSLRKLNKIVEIKDKVDNLVVKQLAILKFIDTIENNESKKKILKPILNVLRDNEKYKITYDIYLNKIKNLQDKINKKINNNKYEPKDKKNIVDWETIKNIKPDTLSDKIFYNFIVKENLFLRLEIFNIKLKNYTENDNYINNGYLFMNKFKNLKSLGKLKFKLGKSTLNLIQQKEDEYLFFNYSNTQSSKTKCIQKFFQKYVGKPIGNNLLRKIFINSKQNSKLSNNQKTRKGKKMLNTLRMWDTVYKKVN